MYTLKDSDEGVCEKCGKDLKLLTHKEMPDGYPAFLICFPCTSVVEVDGDDGQTVEIRRGRRKKFTKVDPKKDEKLNPGAKKQRLIDHQAEKRSRRGKKP